MKRRKFIQQTSQIGLGIGLLGLSACQEPATTTNDSESEEKELFFRLSLAQWSFHKAIRDNKTMPILEYAAKAKSLGFEGVEYVSQLYDLGTNNRAQALADLTKELSTRSSDAGITNVLIMVDGEGDLAAANDIYLQDAIDRHKMWIDSAAEIGCSSVRVNLYGYDFPDDPQGWHQRSVEGLGHLSEYAAQFPINVIVENHGGHSSHGARLAAVLKEVGKSNCGALPDFGNFCVRRDTGDLFNGTCIEEYDRYQGMQELMPFAKGVSAKSYAFNEAGEETTIDFKRMLTIVKDGGFTGFIGVEYEGDQLPEEDGIIATRNLLHEVGQELS